MPKKGYKQTKEHRQALRVPRIGAGNFNKRTKEIKEKVSKSMKGKHNSSKTEFKKGYIVSEETKRKMSEIRLGKRICEGTRKKMSLAQSGEKHYRWNPDREAMKRNLRNDPEYQQWVKQIKKRDGKCKLQNENCSGYLIVHHILDWADYPAERYNINNGITLCQGHHPRKRAEEKRLVPVLQSLIMNY